MNMPLLQTKLTVPPLRRELVPRPRLIERLNRALCQKLTLVSAPAGYGKTTLVAGWLKRRGEEEGERTSPLRIAWISLDAGDNDPARFFAYLIAALQQSDPSAQASRIGLDVQSLLEAPQLPPVEWMVATLINDLAGATVPLVLVLDDYHAISEPVVHQSVEFLLEGQPSAVHTILISRQDPPFPLARWRVRGQLTEIRERDLGFTVEEAVAFCSHTMGLDLPPPEVATLHARTEGWIAGLQMAALALQAGGAEGASALVDGFSGRHHYVLDYLTDEVLRRQPAVVQFFLLHTCLLERMCGALCDELLRGWGASEPPVRAQEMLERLDRANLFIVPLDGERVWYRYHRLFAELLRARLKHERPDGIPELHRRAAAWYAGQALAADAVHHALETGDPAFAAEVIERAVGQAAAWSRLDGATYLSWLEELPKEHLRARPRLLLLAARALYVTGRRDRAESALSELEIALRQDPKAPGAAAMLEQVAADRASYAAMCGEVRRAVAWARPALASVPDGDAAARIRPAATLGLALFRSGEVVEAARAFLTAISAAETAGLSFATVPLLCNLAEVRYVEGRLREALRVIDRAEQVGTVDGQPIPVVGFVGLERARIAYQRGELEIAEQYARDGLDLLRRGRLALGQETLYGVLSQVLQARGDAAGASAAIEQAFHVAHSNDVPRLILQTEAYQARVWLSQGSVEQAVHWAEGYRRGDEMQYLREFEDLTLARVLLSAGRREEALSLLDPLLASAEAAGRLGRVIEALALRALALHAAGAKEDALDVLGRALRVAEPEGHVRPFVDSGRPMAELLVRVVELPVSSLLAAYAGKLLASLGTPVTGRHNLERSDVRPETLAEPLTPRELDVLHLLAEGLTNPEIARRLVVSLPTVKSHTRNLYGKLGVHSRREAVARASVLGILKML